MTAINPLIEVLATTTDVQRLAARVTNGKFKPGFYHILSGLQTLDELKDFIATYAYDRYALD
jgi:hypothetical protein